MKTVDVFIKSFKDDFWLLLLAIETFKRNITGYNKLILLIPEEEKELFDTRNMPDRTLIYYVNDYGNRYLYQQVCKVQAYKYSNADFIMYSDSDVLFDHKVYLPDLVKDNKPEVLYTSWDKVEQAIVWKAPTEAFLKEPVEYERMRRNNQVVHRSTLIGMSKFAPDLEKTIMDSHSFSEFNAMMAFAYKYENKKYTWINTDTWEYVPPVGMQVWSRGNKEPGADDLHLRQYIRILETIMTCFDVPLPK